MPNIFMKTCVVISTYNGCKYVLEQLESIKNQSIKVDGVFIIDDCSKDNTYNLIQNYIKKNNLKNWKVTVNKKNVGWKDNFINIIKTVSSEYDIIFLCDQDDIWHKDKVKKMITCFINDNGLALLVTDYDVKYENKNINKQKKICLGIKKYQRIKFSPRTLNIRRPGCTMAVKRDFAQQHINLYYKKGLAHDKFLWQCAICKNGIGYLKEKLLIYRRSINSASIQSKNTTIIDRESLEDVQYMEALLNIENLDKKYRKIIKYNISFRKKRYNFFARKKILMWILLVRYLNYYVYYRTWLGDLLFIYRHK